MLFIAPLHNLASIGFFWRLLELPEETETLLSSIASSCICHYKNVLNDIKSVKDNRDAERKESNVKEHRFIQMCMEYPDTPVKKLELYHEQHINSTSI